jgi:acyl-lipid (7-3)-desaturase (Delta-4 desaturase)
MVDWIHQHVVQHHVNTNDVHNDPDIVGNAILRLNPLRPLFSVHAWQHIYLFLLIAVFGFTIIEYSLEFVLRGFHHIPMSSLIGSYRAVDACSSLFFIARWFVLPYYQSPSIATFLNIAPMFIVGGYYLAFFFLISHNFDGVVMFDKTTRDPKESFLYAQAASSSNVGGAVLCTINGGLNYQIEHHLFPRIQHCHYPKIAPAVRAFCLKKQIPYVHFPTIGENAAACVRHLFAMGRSLEPIPIIKTAAASASKGTSSTR